MAEKNFEFSQRLEGELRRRDFSKRDFAQEVGIGENTLNKYTKHGGVPEWDILLRMAKNLGLPIEWLLTGAGPNFMGETAEPEERERSGSLLILNRREEALIRALRAIGEDYAKDLFYTIMMRARNAAKEKKLKKEDLEEFNESLKILGEAAIE